MSEEKKKESGEISRREFLKDAGLVVGGATLGSTVFLSACGGDGGASGEVEMEVFDPSGPQEIMNLFVERLGDLNGKTIAGLSSDPTKWQTHRTFPIIFDHIKKRYPGATIIPQTQFTMGTAINDDEVALSVLERGVDGCVVGNAG